MRLGVYLRSNHLNSVIDEAENPDALMDQVLYEIADATWDQAIDEVVLTRGKLSKAPGGQRKMLRLWNRRGREFQRSRQSIHGQQTDHCRTVLSEFRPMSLRCVIDALWDDSCRGEANSGKRNHSH